MINFTDKQWDNVRDNYRKWWKNELGRPILPIMFAGVDPKRDVSKTSLPSYSNVHDFSVTPEEIIDSVDYSLSCLEFQGDSYPSMYMGQYGAGVTAAFLGCEFNNDNNTVWFHPKKVLPIEELHFEYDEDNIWLRRIKDVYRAAVKKWQGQVISGMIDLGGVADILASFRGSQNLLYDLYDDPKEVLRCVNEIQGLWLKFYNEIIDIISPTANGYTEWAGIYSEKPSYMLQSDFCYMISPEMFDTFIGPELAETSSNLCRPFYHLDGIGELPHLDSLLNIDTIAGIQWVPGDGDPVTRDWSDVYSKIGKTGKKIQAYYGLDMYLDEILAVIPKPDQLVKSNMQYHISEKEDIAKLVLKYGLEIK